MITPTEGAQMTRRYSSGTDWEPVVGYSRAVAVGDFVFVSGCTSADGAEVVHEGDAYAQTAQAIGNVGAALAGLGSGLADVVRTRIYVTDISRWAEYGRAHAEAFGEIRPATSMVQVSGLIDERMLVEVEAVAYREGVGGPARHGGAGPLRPAPICADARRSALASAKVGRRKPGAAPTLACEVCAGAVSGRRPRALPWRRARPGPSTRSCRARAVPARLARARRAR